MFPLVLFLPRAPAGYQLEESGKLLQPHEVNLYHFNYDHILPQTAPDDGIELKGLKGTADLGDEIWQGSYNRPGALGIILRATYDVPRAANSPVLHPFSSVNASLSAEDRGLKLLVKIQKGRFTVSGVDGSVKTQRADHGLPKEVVAEGSISYKELLSPLQRLAAWYCRLARSIGEREVLQHEADMPASLSKRGECWFRSPRVKLLGTKT